MLYWQGWMDQARSAHRTAALARGAGEHAWACFLYQQCSELALKGALERHGKDHTGHSVIGLLNDLEAACPGVRTDRARNAARRLSRLYIPTRYPDASGGAPAELYAAEDSSLAQADADVLLALAEKAIADADGSNA